MKRLAPIALSTVFLFLSNTAWADRGPIIWNEGVELIQESQKAIILHNRTEEILILGTEMRAKSETEILEFIPFPSEPKVSPAPGNPFAEVSKLIANKGLLFEYYDPLFPDRGENATATTAPVEIRFSEKIGLHDVTTIKINDGDQFSQWLGEFFKNKGIAVPAEKLQRVYANARDYLQRGYPFFVFDSVKIPQQLRFLEPLVYRFRTDKVYFPLKTSNLIGGTGAVELILILPGSVSNTLWEFTPKIFAQGGDRELHLSSSAKLHPAEVKGIYDAESFFDRSKIYLQVIKYQGPYDFIDDFTYDPGNLIPYAHRFREESPFPEQSVFRPQLTPEERRDMREAGCSPAPSSNRLLSDLRAAQLNCGAFIPPDEYEVASALLLNHQLSGIPRDLVILEKNTTRQRYEGKNIDKNLDAEIQKNFNENNKVAYALENVFPIADGLKIGIRGEEKVLPLAKGKTYISRAGFNKARTAALVYVEHITGPRSGIGYFVILEKKNSTWIISGSHLGTIY